MKQLKIYSMFKLNKTLVPVAYCLLPIAYCLSPVAANAQKDTTKKTTIDITSSYKPVLRNAVKINFSASQLNADTSRPKLDYNIPPQNLFYSYQPIPLKPVALAMDSYIMERDAGIARRRKVRTSLTPSKPCAS